MGNLLDLFFSIGNCNVHFVFNVIYMGETELLLTVILFNLFFILFIISILVYIKRYKEKKLEYQKELKIKIEKHQKEILRTQIEIQQQTMAEIGRELHDNIGQKLTLASLYSQQIVFENDVPEIKEKIEQVTLIIDESIGVLRGLSKSLTDDKIAKNSIVKLIQEEVDKVSILKKCSVNFSNNFTLSDAAILQKSVLLRVVQESIQNCMKHADCSHIEIQLSNPDDEILLIISDNGKGFDVKKSSSGIGLKNMKKRVEMLNGKLTLVSTLNVGSTVTARIKQ